MRKKAIIFDLDNTIYPVSSIGDKILESLFFIIEKSGEFSGDLIEIKKQLQRRPFQIVANDFAFSENLRSACLNMLSCLTVKEKLVSFKGYETLRDIPSRKFLVTVGFTKMQYSKIEKLGIENDFENIYVIDPRKSHLTKKDVFKKILFENQFKEDEVLVVGDDLNSEIKAATELGIETVLFSHDDQCLDQEKCQEQITICNLKDLKYHI